MKTDSLFYRLFQSDPTLVFQLAGLSVPEPDSYRFVSFEVKQTSFRLDGVLEPPDDLTNAPLLFVEVQFQPDDGLYLRFLSEVLLYLRQYQPASPWQAVAFYPHQSVERHNPADHPWLSLPNLHRVYLNELPLLDAAQPSLCSPRLWLISLILAEENRLPAIVERIQDHQAQHPEDATDWLDLLETFLVYKLPHFTREEIQAMFGLNYSDLKHTRFYQQVFEEGKDEGEIEGRTKGRVEGEVALLERLLLRRFGSLSENTRCRIATADADTLLLWGERLLDAKTLEDVWGAV